MPPSDADALARAIRELLAAPETRKNMGIAGRARAEREFSKQALATRMLALYGRGTGTATGTERIAT